MYSLFLDKFEHDNKAELIKNFEYIKCKRCGKATDFPNFDINRHPMMPVDNLKYKLFFNNYKFFYEEEGDMKTWLITFI